MNYTTTLTTHRFISRITTNLLVLMHPSRLLPKGCSVSITAHDEHTKHASVQPYCACRITVPVSIHPCSQTSSFPPFGYNNRDANANANAHDAGGGGGGGAGAGHIDQGLLREQYAKQRQFLHWGAMSDSTFFPAPIRRVYALGVLAHSTYVRNAT
ncbi:hypothetical protein M378DRAFT_739611 [Amanita muscaria Koide BX008]|uniref:Uncharacterized protein n=1 Tax=Amanita muscaria (strain Koide BX008) TaxID=946122 RepID=A0A0C2X1A6_AMAMK|nr:hypothetical protein M378DRAFT_739611 [Amanita muscaria Koide BX008]